MRPPVLAVCFAFLLLCAPINDRPDPTTSAEPAAATPDERVVMDAVVWTMPGLVNDTCLQFPPGHLTVSLRLEPVGVDQPVRFWFSPFWYRPADVGADIQANVTRELSPFEATLAGGRYCYALAVTPVTSITDSNAVGDQAQLVALKMTLAPGQ